jgi:hypothetical protein
MLVQAILFEASRRSRLVVCHLLIQVRMLLFMLQKHTSGLHRHFLHLWSRQISHPQLCGSTPNWAAAPAAFRLILCLNAIIFRHQGASVIPCASSKSVLPAPRQHTSVDYQCDIRMVESFSILFRHHMLVHSVAEQPIHASDGPCHSLRNP